MSAEPPPIKLMPRPIPLVRVVASGLLPSLSATMDDDELIAITYGEARLLEEHNLARWLLLHADGRSMAQIKAPKHAPFHWEPQVMPEPELAMSREDREQALVDQVAADKLKQMEAWAASFGITLNAEAEAQ